MKDIIKITFNLVVIFVIAGLVVAVVYSIAGPKIANNQKIEEEKARKELMPAAASIPSAGKWVTAEGKKGEYYVAKDANGNDVGYLITSYGKGYAGYIKVLVAVNKDMTVKAIKPLSHTETPGLGDELDKPYFQKRFEGKRLDQLEVVKQPDPNKIEAISGATISSRGVTNGVRQGVKFLMEKYQGGVANVPAQ
jgi:electron transport complex protein RnfG